MIKSFLPHITHPYNLPGLLYTVFSNLRFTKTLKRQTKKMVLSITLVLLTVFTISTSVAQSTGCVAGRFGIDAGLYSGVIEYGSAIEPASPRTNDWFQGAAGLGVISQANTTTLQTLLQGGGNPTYEEHMIGEKVSINGGQIWIDAIFARDQFGGTGFEDATTFLTASKNGEDPAIWDPGEMNVLGKNDIIDAGGFMFRDGTGALNSSDLWFVGLFNMAEPGGTAYMDFEFYVDDVQYTPGSGFTSGGPQLGHTAYNFDGPGNITKIGDFIFSVSLEGSDISVEIRLWVSYADWVRLNGPTSGSAQTFQWTGTFDGAFNNAPYGYAGIKELTGQTGLFCGYVNNDGETPLTPPWGSKGTKTNSYITNYLPNSIAEVGINLTAFGMDHSSLSGEDPCYFPLNTFMVKARASASFTAQLKDFSGPYSWGQPTVSVVSNLTNISCENETATITATPLRTDVGYLWETLDGNIVSGQGTGQITVDEPGTYKLTVTLPTNCPVQSVETVVGYDATKPFFDGPPAYSFTVPCNGNDGTLTVTASGATKPYTFYLYNNLTNTLITQVTKGNTESSHTFTGLTPGNYRVDVKGVYACIESTGPVSIPARIPVVINETLTPVACFGNNTGAINLAVSGGNPPLTYLWNTGNTSKNLLNIGAGTYSVSITDKDGCVTTASYTITQPTQITATIAKTNDPGNAGNGAATVTASGGTSGYTYLWSKTGDPAFVFQPNATGVQVTNLSYGEYTVKVTDVNGCFINVTVFIYQKEICNDGIDNDGDGLNNCDDSDCIPATSDPITASDNSPCVDPDGIAPYAYTYTYSVPVNSTYESYVWTVPASAVIVSGQGTNVITVAWISLAGGQICVQGKIYDCLSAPVCINVVVDDVPPPATNIKID